MADLRLLRSSLEAFAGEVGRPLTGWQARALGLERRVTVIVAPRQSGKSRSLALLGLWRAFREPGHRVLVVSAGEESARRLLAEVRSVALGSPLLAGSVVDDQAALVTLLNGSEVRSVPASSRQIRGWSVDTLLLDECALIADELVLDAALPTTAARPLARVVMASSATVAAGAFYDHAMRGEAGSEHVRTFRWALSDASEWIAPSAVAAARESMSELRFRAEFMGEFASGADALFTRGALDRVTADFLPDVLEALEGPARVLAGCDWGATTDRSALVAIGRLPGPERRFGVRCAKRWPAGHPLSKVTEEIAGSPAFYDTVCAETNGLGLPVAQELTARLRERGAGAGGATVERGPVLVDEEWFERTARARRRPIRLPGSAPPFATRPVLAHTSAPMKAAAYSSLRLLIDHERLLLPASAGELLRELLMLRVDLSPSGGERIEAGSGHDDLADALMLSTVPYKSRRDGRWRVYLAELAEPNRPLPDPALDGVDLTALEVTATGGGVEVPRTPVWASVRGPEVTVPAAARREDPVAVYWRRQQEAVRRVRAANRP